MGSMHHQHRMRFEYSPVIPHRALDRVLVLRNALALYVTLHPLSARLLRAVPVTPAFALGDEAPSLEVMAQARPGVCIRFKNACRIARTLAQACVSSDTCGSHLRLAAACFENTQIVFTGHLHAQTGGVGHRDCLDVGIARAHLCRAIGIVR